MHTLDIRLFEMICFLKGSDQLSVPQTTESRMAKMKKKISSPLLKRRNLSDGEIFLFHI